MHLSMFTVQRPNNAVTSLAVPLTQALSSACYRSIAPRRSLLGLAALLSLGWTLPASAAPPCIQANTPFQVAYVQQSAFGTDTVTMDLTTHSYRFKPRVNMTLCSIGYQSPPSPPTKYRIQLVDVTGAPVVLYSQLVNPLVAFPPPPPPFTPSYVPVGPITLLAGRKYLLSRKAIGYSNTNQLIGRLLTNQAGQFPISAPSLQILSSKFSGGGGPNVNQLLPFIDFGTY